MPTSSFRKPQLRSRAVRLAAPESVGAPVANDVDPDIIAAFRRGDPGAVGEIYEAYAGSLMAVATSVLGDPTAAADVVQQTFLKAWRAADTLDPKRPLGPWLRTIARRTALDAIRYESRRTGPPLSAVPEPAGAPVSFDAPLIAGEVRDALDQLPIEEREVIQLAHLDGLSHAEVARALGVPIGTVKSRSSRAHRRLASALRFLRDEGDQS